MLRPGMIIADCGAHTGLTACLFSKWVGAEGQVFAFEANPKNHKVLDRNIRNNNVENITSENLAVSKQEGVVIISDHGNSSISGASNKDGGVPVRSISLNDYFKNLEVYPNMIKVDVEGHEEEVLLGASEILKRGAALDLEIHSILFPANTRANKVARILALLPLSGRDCYIQPNVDGDILPYDPIVHTSSFIASFEVTHFFML
jgi:FkbM family methyltransferase